MTQVSSESDQTSSRSDIRFNALRNAIYHTARRLYFERLARATSFVVILFGTATFSQLAESSSLVTFALGAALATVGALQIVYDFGGQARTHQILQRDYYRLLSEIERTPSPAAVDLARWQGELASLSGEEPPTMRALDAVAYNAAADALYLDHRSAIRVTWFQNMMKQVLAFNSTTFADRSIESSAGGSSRSA